MPTERSRGPWNREHVIGMMVAGLLAHEVEQHLDGFHPARLTVDMFRAVPWAPLETRSRVVREGRRVKAIDASLLCEGREVSRASALLLRRSAEPPGRIAQPPEPEVPPPEQLESDEPWVGDAVGGSWETRSVRRPGEMEPAVRWTRLLQPLLPGVPLSPFVRAAAASDSASPLSNVSDQGLYFINADATLYLHRPPEGEWLCLAVRARGSQEGVAVAECALLDARGPVGRCLVASLAMPQGDRWAQAEGQLG